MAKTHGIDNLPEPVRAAARDYLDPNLPADYEIMSEPPPEGAEVYPYLDVLDYEPSELQRQRAARLIGVSQEPGFLHAVDDNRKLLRTCSRFPVKIGH